VDSFLIGYAYYTLQRSPEPSLDRDPDGETRRDDHGWWEGEAPMEKTPGVSNGVRGQQQARVNKSGQHI